MKGRRWMLVLGAWGVAAAMAGMLAGMTAGMAAMLAGCGRGAAERVNAVVVSRGDVRLTLPFQGELEARRMEMIAVRLQGAAVLTELAAEGTRVEAGELLARFDSAQIEQDLTRLENEWVRARQELDSLEKAELPLELIEMDAKRSEAQAELEAEERFLEAARDLAERGVMSAGELVQQEEKIAALRERGKQLDVRMELTKKHVHAARLAKAQAALAAAEAQRQFSARQMELSEVRAPVAGVVTLVPLSIGGEYRAAHVGDTLYRNQVFMCLPDPSEFVVRGYVGEAELPWVRPGHPLTAAPVAFPEALLTGRVESIGGMAQTRPGQPLWRKYFPVQIALEDCPDYLPVGISVRAEILAGVATNVLRVPREAVEWRDGGAWVRVLLADGREEPRPIEAGLADATHVEVRAGLEEGMRVLAP